MIKTFIRDCYSICQIIWKIKSIHIAIKIEEILIYIKLEELNKENEWKILRNFESNKKIQAGRLLGLNSWSPNKNGIFT
jgi:hypothetical protein